MLDKLNLVFGCKVEHEGGKSRKVVARAHDAAPAVYDCGRISSVYTFTPLLFDECRDMKSAITHSFNVVSKACLLGSR